MKQHVVTILCLGVYVLLGLALNWRLRRRNQTAEAFLHSSRDLPIVVTALSFLAANCTALEVLTVAAIAAKYGMIAVHFYWLGAVPALASLLCFLLPRYRQLGIRSVPAYLQERFTPSARLVSGAAFSALMVAMAGITLYVGAQLLNFAVGLPLRLGVWSLAAFAGLFLLGGGLGALLYAEATQLLIFLLLLLPLMIVILRQAGNPVSLVHRLPPNAQHTFATMPLLSPRASSDIFGTVLGLGVVLSSTYWCADFLLIQRLGAARDTTTSLRTPALAIVAKIFLPLVLILPGLWIRVLKLPSDNSFDLLLPRLVFNTYPPFLAEAATAVVACSLLLGFCGNIAAGTAIFVSDVCQPLVLGTRRVSRELSFSRGVSLALVFLAAACAHFNTGSNALMENVQLALSSFSAPVGTAFLAGVICPWFTRRAGTVGILCGTAAGVIFEKAAALHLLFPGLSRSFYTAIVAAGSTLVAMTLASFHRGVVGLRISPEWLSLDLNWSPFRFALAGSCLLIVTVLYLLLW